MPTVVVASSEEIASLAEARAYYHAKLARSHSIACGSATVEIVFERDATHLFSEDAKDINAVPDHLLVTRNIGGGKREVRKFSLERARLMDSVLPAISRFTHCTSGVGPPSRSTRLIHGQRLPCGRYMCVALRPGPGPAWTCQTAFPVVEAKYAEKCRARRVKFPP